MKAPHLARWICCCAIAAAGCSTNTTSNSSNGTTISGAVSAAPVGNANVIISAATDAGIAGISLGTVATVGSGDFNALIAIAPSPAYIHVSASGGIYIEEASGKPATLTQPMQTLVAAADFNTTQAVTPLTQIATVRAQYLAANGNSLADAAAAAYYQVAAAAGLTSISTPPANPNGVSDPNSAAAKYAAVLAGISQFAADHNCTSGDATQALASDFSQDGSFNGKNGNGNVTLTTAGGGSVALSPNTWSQQIPAAITTYINSPSGQKGGFGMSSAPQLNPTPPTMPDAGGQGTTTTGGGSTPTNTGGGTTPPGNGGSTGNPGNGGSVTGGVTTGTTTGNPGNGGSVTGGVTTGTTTGNPGGGNTGAPGGPTTGGNTGGPAGGNGPPEDPNGCYPDNSAFPTCGGAIRQCTQKDPPNCGTFVPCDPSAPKGPLCGLPMCDPTNPAAGYCLPNDCKPGAPNCFTYVPCDSSQPTGAVCGAPIECDASQLTCVVPEPCTGPNTFGPLCAQIQSCDPNYANYPGCPGAGSGGCDPNDPNCIGGGGCDPNDPNCMGGGGCDPNDPNCMGGGGCDPNDPNCMGGGAPTCDPNMPNCDVQVNFCPANAAPGCGTYLPCDPNQPKGPLCGPPVCDPNNPGAGFCWPPCDYGDPNAICELFHPCDPNDAGGPLCGAPGFCSLSDPNAYGCGQLPYSCRLNTEAGPVCGGPACDPNGQDGPQCGAGCDPNYDNCQPPQFMGFGGWFGR